jgi:hypothetical protein
MNKWLLAVGLTAALTGSVVQAQIPDEHGDIHACVAKNGSVRIIDLAVAVVAECPKGEQELIWPSIDRMLLFVPGEPSASVVVDQTFMVTIRSECGIGREGQVPRRAIGRTLQNIPVGSDIVFDGHGQTNGFVDFSVWEAHMLLPADQYLPGVSTVGAGWMSAECAEYTTS